MSPLRMKLFFLNRKLSIIQTASKEECLEMNKMEPARNINLPPTLRQDCHCHNQCVFFYTLVSYYHFFFSHIADMPGLACLNLLTTEVKSKSNPVCDCTTAALLLVHCKRSTEEGQGSVRV